LEFPECCRWNEGVRSKSIGFFLTSILGATVLKKDPALPVEENMPGLMEEREP
jgi:hypothetical protein